MIKTGWYGKYIILSFLGGLLAILFLLSFDLLSDNSMEVVHLVLFAIVAAPPICHSIYVFEIKEKQGGHYYGTSSTHEQNLESTPNDLTRSTRT